MFTSYLFLEGSLFLICIGGFFQVSQFLRLHGAVTTAGDLDDFKRMVRVNMYVALVYIVLGIPSILLSMYLSFAYGIYGMVIAIGATVPHFFLGKHMKKLDERSRNLECSSRLDSEYKRIGQVWRKKALPDF